MTKDYRTFQVLLVGNPRVGKTSFLHRYLNKKFDYLPEPTPAKTAESGVDKYDVLLHTNARPVRYEVFDVSGSQKPNDLVSVIWDKFDAAIIMFDLTDRISYNNVPNWYQGLVDKDGMRRGRFIPICICGNKEDAPIDLKLPPKFITFPKKKRTGYVEMSVKCLSNIHEPFLDLARQLLDIPHLEYKSLPDVGPAEFIPQVAAFIPQMGLDRPQQNGSRDHKYAIAPRVQTKEIPSPESQIRTIAGTSAENSPNVTEPPKEADASNGRLKFISTTNKPQNEVKPPVNRTASVRSEVKSAVNGAVPVAKSEQPKPCIVPTEEHEQTKKHHEPTKEHCEQPKQQDKSRKAHESPVATPNPVKDQSLFVLCIHCIRMVLIKCIQGTPLAQLSSSKHSFAFITTACRSCCIDSKKSQSDEVCMSPDLIRYTAMYECARKVAEDEVEVLATKKSVAHISLDKLTNSIGRECQIQGIATSSDILQRLREVARKDVLLGYVPGAFL